MFFVAESWSISQMQSGQDWANWATAPIEIVASMMAFSYFT